MPTSNNLCVCQTDVVVLWFAENTFDSNACLPGACAIVVFSEMRAQPPGFRSHDGIELGIVVGLSPEDLGADDGLLEFVMVSLQMPIDYEPQKTGQPLIARKARAIQYLLELSPYTFPSNSTAVARFRFGYFSFNSP